MFELGLPNIPGMIYFAIYDQYIYNITREIDQRVSSELDYSELDYSELDYWNFRVRLPINSFFQCWVRHYS